MSKECIPLSESLGQDRCFSSLPYRKSVNDNLCLLISVVSRTNKSFDVRVEKKSHYT